MRTKGGVNDMELVKGELVMGVVEEGVAGDGWERRADGGLGCGEN